MRKNAKEAEKTECLTLTVEEAGRILGISRGLAYEMARCGKLPTIRFGHRILIPKAALEKMLNRPQGYES